MKSAKYSIESAVVAVELFDCMLIVGDFAEAQELPSVIEVRWSL